MTTFRFDDVSVNTDIDTLYQQVATIYNRMPDAMVILAISPIVFDQDMFVEGSKQRVHPPILTAMSELHHYYAGTRCGVPDLRRVLNINPRGIETAGHGLAHVDHRLLGRKSQEMSIVMSCALAQGSIFVPPYNKYNDITMDVCDDHAIELVKFTDGWLHAGHNTFDPRHLRYYLHPFDKTPQQFQEWLR